MKQIFLDCGYYVGDVQKMYRNFGILNDDWEIYAWDANPDLDLPDFVAKKAVWVDDKGVEFQIGGRHDASSIRGTSGHDNPKILKVPSFDFSEFVDKLPDAYIICSMDVEGAEFDILDKMIKDRTIDKINLFDIEFHHRLMLDKTADDAQVLVDEMLSRGITVRLKVPLS